MKWVRVGGVSLATLRFITSYYVKTVPCTSRDKGRHLGSSKNETYKYLSIDSCT